MVERTRKRFVEGGLDKGMTYAIHPVEVRDMMRRYDVIPVENGN